MSDYTRTTRECAVAELKPELLEAIRAYSQEHKLGNIEAEAVLRGETHSEKKKKGFFAALGGDPDPVNDMALLLTPAWLVWARGGPKSGTVVSGARLRDIQVSAYSSKLIPDSGLEVQSPLVGSAERAESFIPLSADLAPAITERIRLALAHAA